MSLFRRQIGKVRADALDTNQFASTIWQMSDTYHGESFSKKLARLLFWSAVSRTQPGFGQGEVVILASREGGDIPILKALGVPPKNIIAIERNPEAALACQAKFPDVRVRQADVFHYTETRAKNISSAFLDLCCPIDSKIYAALQRVHDVLSDGCTLGVATLRGRERSRMAKRDIVAAADALQSSTFARQYALGLRLSKGSPILQTSPRANRSTFGINYNSHDGSKRGSPMSIAAFIVGQSGPSLGFCFDLGSSTEDDLRESIYTLSQVIPVSRLAALLNVKTGSIPALKAWAKVRRNWVDVWREGFPNDDDGGVGDVCPLLNADDGCGSFQSNREGVVSFLSSLWGDASLKDVAFAKERRRDVEENPLIYVRFGTGTQNEQEAAKRYAAKLRSGEKPDDGDRRILLDWALRCEAKTIDIDTHSPSPHDVATQEVWAEHLRRTHTHSPTPT